MLKLEDIRKNAVLVGIVPGQVVRVVAAEPAGADSITVYYKTADGHLGERMLFRADELALAPAEAGRPWAFDAPGADFKLAAEAFRIRLAHLFDPMMAVHASDVMPLPHQITAVYEAMLPRQPLTFVLADDPGAGKTIMAGLLIRELSMRGDAERVLIVAPGSLVEQWHDEMSDKFGLEFRLFSRQQVEESLTGNPFDENDLLIARLDQLARNADLQEKLKASHWDLIVVDEAHKMSASFFGNELKETQRFKLGHLLRETTRHFLLMTATPHNGKEEDFRLFLSLLDPDRFAGRVQGAAPPDHSDLMRRMVKEDLRKFDGSLLFPERKAYAPHYDLSPLEMDLYEAVTRYVKDQWSKAEELKDGRRRGNVGFALTTLQRRLASSPEAIYQSLKNRHHRLERRLEEERLGGGGPIVETLRPPPEDPDELSAEEEERYEEEVVDQATASQSVRDLEGEIRILQDLEERARQLVHSRQDRKWDELSKILQNTPAMFRADGRRRKLIVFTEHRATLNYLERLIGDVLGNPKALVTLHGGTPREERRAVQERFRTDPELVVLVATDAAGEGVNLQCANLMINYDLPWNPNRLEQRFGRIHRIGQEEVCHLWNLVAKGTREGDVFTRLLQKLATESGALEGRVFDILGQVFEEKSLRDLLIEAIRYGEDPARKAEVMQQVDGALDPEHLREILARRALDHTMMDERRVFEVREEMEKAEAKKLQPYFLRSFFSAVFTGLGGELRPREAGRFEIPHVPAVLRELDRRPGASDRVDRDLRDARRRPVPLMRKYERVCFDKEAIRLKDRPGAPVAQLVHPAHPLLAVATDYVLAEHRGKLKQGAVLVDPTDPGTRPRLLVLLDHSVREGGEGGRTVSRRLQFVEIDSEGGATSAGVAPHLDLEAISPGDLAIVRDVLEAPWLTGDLERVALGVASTRLVPEHFEEVRRRREGEIDRTLQAVQERLVREIERPRLEARKALLEAQRHVVSAPPVVVGGADRAEVISEVTCAGRSSNAVDRL